MVEIIVNPYKSIVIDSEDGLLTISEGDAIKFTIESTGEIKQGSITKFMGKDEKLKIQMIPTEQNYEEIWPVVAISEGSLKLVEDNEDDEDNE
jgi:hypothetical protein